MVYVDDMHQTPMGRFRMPSGRVARMSHMIADTTEELDRMARSLGLKPEWKQKPGTAYEHYDVTTGVRERAVTLGAKEISMRAAVMICKGKK